MSCCCPPAISALFCLWARSGFSKSSVAGALTFFPPDPPLYKFTKVYDNDDNDGDQNNDNDNGDERDKMIKLPTNTTTTTIAAVDKNKDCQKQQRQEEEEEEAEDNSNNNNNTMASDNDEKNALATNPINDPLLNSNTTIVSMTTNENTTARTGPSSPLRLHPQDTRPTPSSPSSITTPISSTPMPTPGPVSAPEPPTIQPDVHPATALMQRSLQLRQEAKHKNRQDAQDASMGVKYTFHPDPRLVPPPGYSGSIEAVKIPHLQAGKSSSNSNKLLPCRKGGAKDDTSHINHVACVIYRIREDRVTERTKTIVYSHGNATDIGAMHFMQVIIAKGLRCNVVMYDYSGYGESGGVPLEENTYKDIEAVYQYVLDHVVLNGRERNIILYGQSVGGGPSCYLAAKKKDVGGLILHSAFMSGMRVLTPSRALACLDIFPNITRIQSVQCPVMVIHGMLDEEVGFEHGVALHDAIPENCKRNPWWVRDRGHNDITDGRQKILEYIQKLKTFMDSLGDD